jgi:hypothetical protein
MSQNLFRVYTERGVETADLVKMADLFTPDVVFHSPLLTWPVRGKAVVHRILAEAFSHTGLPQYTLELTNGPQTVFLWDGEVNGYLIQGVIVISEDAQGRIYDISSLMRPYPVLDLLWKAMMEVIYALLPPGAWAPATLSAEVPQFAKSSPTS